MGNKFKIVRLIISIVVCSLVIIVITGLGNFTLAGEDAIPHAGSVSKANNQDLVATSNVSIAVEESVETEEIDPVLVLEEKNQPAVTAIIIEKLKTKQEAVDQSGYTAPVTYSWGTTSNYTFLMEVEVTNNGAGISKNVTVDVPLLENNSPYQETTLELANYEIISTNGRVSTFYLGDIAPGASKTIIVHFHISMRTVSITSTNDTIEKARIAYELYAGSGNCRTLALGFISKCEEMGITAREVIGFARPFHGAMTSGSLQGSRHSWAEFYVDGLGWVPVDLTFKYFGTLPFSSHIVESYSDKSVSVQYTGGSLSARWSNAIL